MRPFPTSTFSLAACQKTLTTRTTTITLTDKVTIFFSRSFYTQTKDWMHVTQQATPTTSLPSINLTNDRHSKSFSSEALSTEKRSPHSKFLRVCSNRNSNRHFAAIEAELLRLDWNASMEALLLDWMEHDKWCNIVELEANIRVYVENNAPFLMLQYREDSDSSGNGLVRKLDRIRMEKFPYERIIAEAVKRAIGERLDVDGSSAQLSALLSAGTLLDAMTIFEMEQDQGRDIAWTSHHSSCSKCFKMVVSGWFLFWRRIAEGKDLMNHTTEGTKTLPPVDVHPEEKMYSYTEKWIRFCTNGRDEQLIKDDNNALLGGISGSDKSLLMSVSQVVLLSKDVELRMRYLKLVNEIERLFPEKDNS